MKHFAQALSQIIHNEKTLKICSKIEAETSKTLFRKAVRIREISSGVCFDAFVVDYSAEDNTGIIISFDKKDAKKLHLKKQCGVAERNPETRVELDLRESFHGNYFELVAVL